MAQKSFVGSGLMLRFLCLRRKSHSVESSPPKASSNGAKILCGFIMCEFAPVSVLALSCQDQNRHLYNSTDSSLYIQNLPTMLTNSLVYRRVMAYTMSVALPRTGVAVPRTKVDEQSLTSHGLRGPQWSQGTPTRGQRRSFEHVGVS